MRVFTKWMSSDDSMGVQTQIFGGTLCGVEPQQVPIAEQAEPAESVIVRRSTRSSTQKNTQETSQTSVKRQAQADSESRNVGGFNFVQDLPRFLVLLYALQRSNPEDWGRNPAFTPNLQENNVASYTVEVGGKEVTLDNKRTTRFGLAGRGTDVMDATCATLEEEKTTTEEMQGGLVAKIYWGEEARASEEEILKNVMDVAAGNEAVQGHVPVLRLAKKFTVSTSTIRKALGLENPGQGSRTLFILVFKKLSPITELQSDELLDAWRQCVLCHYVLWKAGIHHRDVSCDNLMYYRVDGQVIGVLNDYDLVSLASDTPLGNQRTGTMLFMAIDLLKQTARMAK
ncbi:hypothetical protein PAXINDRAFT_11106 [Paxillus involutus ATCC 200175]|nr:hypothetical protein PAXINDRAFT_11106 [Paxillus involutus ATCC 200175]